MCIPCLGDGDSSTSTANAPIQRQYQRRNNYERNQNDDTGYSSGKLLAIDELNS